MRPTEPRDELAQLDALGQAELVRMGTVSAGELVEAAIERVEQLNPQLNAVIHTLFEPAREAAAGAIPEGPFTGVPFPAQGPRGHPCRAALTPRDAGAQGARLHRPVDTYLAQHFRAAGLVTIGKTDVPELGIQPTTEPVACGPTRNPWDLGLGPADPGRRPARAGPALGGSGAARVRGVACRGCRVEWGPASD